MKLLDKTMTPSLLGGDVSYDDLRKQAFHKSAKRLLRRIADELGLVKGQYDLRSNLGGIAVSGEITLHTDTLYLQLSQGVLTRGQANILYRRCSGRKDYVGMTNHFIAVADLHDREHAARFVSHLAELGGITRPTEVEYGVAA